MNQKLAPITLVTMFSLAMAAVYAQDGTPPQTPPPSSIRTKTSKGLGDGKLPGGPMQMMGAPGAPAKPPWQEFKLNPKTTIFLDFTDSNPDMIISIFSRTSGITILKDPTFKTTLTVTSAKAVHLDE